MDRLGIPVNSYTAIRTRLTEIAEIHINNKEYDPISKYKHAREHLIKDKDRYSKLICRMLEGKITITRVKIR